MKLSTLIAGLLLAIAFLVIDSSTVKAQPQTGEKVKIKKVIIKPGDTLTKIAKKHKTTYVRLFYANAKIKHPDIIYPGDKIRIPKADEKLKKRPIPNVTVPAKINKRTNATSLTQPKAPVLPANFSSGNTVWDRLAACESGGNWSINTGNGYYGGLQFTLSSWRAVGGSGYPHQASKAEQIKRATMLQAIQGWGAWPACSAKLGIS